VEGNTVKSATSIAALSSMTVWTLRHTLYLLFAYFKFWK